MLRLEQIPMRQDNYSYALIKDDSVIMIDPSEPEESRAYFSAHPNYRLTAILTTHSHIDHVGGNDVLWNDWQCPIYGPAREKDRIPHLSHPLKDQDEIHELGLTIHAFDVRAHTSGHMAFLVDALVDEVVKQGHQHPPYMAKDLAKRRVMFVGDSLFAAGCGRLFEGSQKNLADCLSFYNHQDPELLMACAHEYTKSNLKFAHAMLPDHEGVLGRLHQIDDLLQREGSSIPCLFGLEQKTNPFLLVLKEPNRSRLSKKFGIDFEDLTAVVGQLRLAKDEF